MPSAEHTAKAAAIAGLAEPLAIADLAIPIDDPIRPDWVVALGHLRQLYRAAQHQQLGKAIDSFIEGHPLPRVTEPALHRAGIAAALHRAAKHDPKAKVVAAIAEPIAALWPAGETSTAQLRAIVAHARTLSAE